MTETFRCGHPKTPENTTSVGGDRTACRQCRLEYKERWRERVRQLAEARKHSAPLCGPVALPPEMQPQQPLTAEAIGSRNLLIAYARYYENHVKSRAA